MITKGFTILIGAIIPKSLRGSFFGKINDTKRVLNSSKELKLFWGIILFPINLVLSLISACFKLILVWLIPRTKYNSLVYIFEHFYKDIVTFHVGIKTAFKRAFLLNELFTKGAEKHKSFGELNPDITFYVIRPYYFLKPNELIYRNVANLLTQYYYVVQKLSYALRNGWVPIVDWENYGKLPHAEDYPVNGTNNSWEYYWKQPCDYTLEEVYQSKNVILSTQNIGQFGHVPNCAMSPPYNTYARRLVDMCPQYTCVIPLNDTTLKYVDEAQEKYFPKDERVLGVVVRGASYGRTGTPYHSHPMQATMEELISAVHRYLDEWEIEYIFFVNEMQELVDAMVEEFGDKVIVLPRMRDTFGRPADGVTKNPMYADGQRYQTNLDYITEVALLSRCTSIVGSMSSGMRTALIWNAGKYENMHVFEKGLW